MKDEFFRRSIARKEARDKVTPVFWISPEQLNWKVAGSWSIDNV
jgi:hypothetical protein